jgi:CheY-like chemotaxis protein
MKEETLKLRALVVEDCAAMRNLLMQMLPLTGLAEFEFTEAKDGADALARFRPELIDIIFADCNMPLLSGTDFVRQVRGLGNTAHIPIVMVTGLRAASSVEAAIDEAGADLYITKPYTIEDLRKNLADAVERIKASDHGPGATAGNGLPRQLMGNTG